MGGKNRIARVHWIMSTISAIERDPIDKKKKDSKELNSNYKFIGKIIDERQLIYNNFFCLFLRGGIKN